ARLRKDVHGRHHHLRRQRPQGKTRPDRRPAAWSHASRPHRRLPAVARLPERRSRVNESHAAKLLSYRKVSAKLRVPSAAKKLMELAKRNADGPKPASSAL